MKKQQLKNLKTFRIISQAFFLGLFIFIFIRSLDPFSNIFNPFLRYDPLIFFTHQQPKITIIIPIIGILLLTILFGRFFCGWLCPFGLYMDLLTRIRKAFGRRHLTLSEKTNDAIGQLRYIIIAIFIKTNTAIIFFKKRVCNCIIMTLK